MKYRILLYFTVSLFIGLVIFSCSDDENPFTSNENERLLFGTVIDQQGNPVPGVSVHYIPSLIDTGLQKSAFLSPQSSTFIIFGISEQFHVTLVLLKHSTRDTLSYLLNNQLLNPGTHQVEVNTETLTNGIYDYVLKYGTTIEEASFLIQKSPEELISTNPLAITDSDGKFELNYSEFGIGSIFRITSETSYELLNYKEISNSIQIVLIKENFNQHIESIVIDTNKVIIKNFIITKL